MVKPKKLLIPTLCVVGALVWSNSLIFEGYCNALEEVAMDAEWQEHVSTWQSDLPDVLAVKTIRNAGRFSSRQRRDAAFKDLRFDKYWFGAYAGDVSLFVWPDPGGKNEVVVSELEFIGFSFERDFVAYRVQNDPSSNAGEYSFKHQIGGLTYKVININNKLAVYCD